MVMVALEQLPRIKHLTLTVRHGWPKLREILSSRAAPLLCTFQITSEDGSQVVLPEDIFSGPGGAPQLRRLSLHGCNFNLKFKFLRSLTHLTVVRIPTGCRVSVNDLVTNLGRMSQPESIHLSSVLIPLLHSEPNDPSSPSTHLPFITHIHLEENLMSCLTFFTKLTYPNTAIVSIKCSHPVYQTDNIASSVRDLITIINAKNIVPITSLYVENLDHGTFRGQDSQWIRRVFIEFQDISFEPSSISWDSLALHRLRSLQVGIKVLRPVWLGIFGELKNLQTIVITDYASEFLDALSHGLSISRDATGAQTVPSCPRAKRLNFNALNFLSLSSPLGRDYSGKWPWPDKLVSCFRERRRRGFTLRRLCIEGYGDGADVVRQTNPFIKHIEWTEACETSDEEDYEDYYDDYDDSHYRRY